LASMLPLNVLINAPEFYQFRGMTSPYLSPAPGGQQPLEDGARKLMLPARPSIRRRRESASTKRECQVDQNGQAK
jgi:hypothetical protein